MRLRHIQITDYITHIIVKDKIGCSIYDFDIAPIFEAL